MTRHPETTGEVVRRYGPSAPSPESPASGPDTLWVLGLGPLPLVHHLIAARTFVVPAVGSVPVAARDIPVAIALQHRRCAPAADLLSDLVAYALHRLTVLLGWSVMLSSIASLTHALPPAALTLQRPCHEAVSRLTID